MIYIDASGYLRYSTNRQDDNHSLEIQKGQIELLAERENLKITKWREDRATSAFRGNVGKRKGILQILDDIANGTEAICFYEESRVTRSITDFYNDVYVPIKSQYPHVKFYSTQSEGEWDPNDPITQAKLVFAAEESEVKSTRAKDLQDKLLKGKKRPGSRIPAGYDMVDGILIPNQDSGIIELIYYLASFGHSNDTISNYLNACNITTEKIKRWNSSTIGYILSNKAYSGSLAWNVRSSYNMSKPKNDNDIKLFTNVHEPIIKPVIAHLVEQTNKLKQKFGLLNTPYYVRGILNCRECRLPLIAKDNSPKGKRGLYMIYRCNKCKKSTSIHPVHEAILNEIQRKWSTQSLELVSEAKNLLKSWSNKLQKAKDKQKQLLEKLFYNKRMMEIEHSDNLLQETFLAAEKQLCADLTTINLTMEEIERLLADSYIDTYISEILRQKLDDLKDNELRVILLMYIDEILINFNKENNLEISYRLSPFVSLENFTGQITEQVRKHTKTTG